MVVFERVRKSDCGSDFAQTLLESPKRSFIPKCVCAHIRARTDDTRCTKTPKNVPDNRGGHDGLGERRDLGGSVDVRNGIKGKQGVSTPFRKRDIGRSEIWD